MLSGRVVPAATSQREITVAHKAIDGRFVLSIREMQHVAAFITNVTAEHCVDPDMDSAHTHFILNEQGEVEFVLTVELGEEQEIVQKILTFPVADRS